MPGKIQSGIVLIKSLREVLCALFELMIEGDLHHLRLIGVDLTGVSELTSLVVIDRAAARLVLLVISLAYEILGEFHPVVVRSVILALFRGHYALTYRDAHPDYHEGLRDVKQGD